VTLPDGMAMVVVSLDAAAKVPRQGSTQAGRMQKRSRSGQTR
jgi:hypothetical protein